LLDCGGTKRIASAQNHRFAALTQVVSELSDRRRFAAAVNAND